MITFLVDGQPIPKQSYRAVKGGGYTDPRVKAWQALVAYKAKEAMQGREMLTGPVAMRVVFVFTDKRRRDLDNLNKGVADAMNGIVFKDDTQVVNLHLVKHVYPKATAGIFVEIHEDGLLPFMDKEATKK